MTTETPAPTDALFARLRAGLAWASARPLVIALAIYLVVEVAFLLTAGNLLGAHTPFNHFALLADAWLHGRLDLGGPPPAAPGTTTSRSFTSACT
ncbi:MAG: hypothetical protein U0414_28195 [Polyangiaceae bacterium]